MLLCLFTKLLFYQIFIKGPLSLAKLAGSIVYGLCKVTVASFSGIYLQKKKNSSHFPFKCLDLSYSTNDNIVQTSL